MAWTIVVQTEKHGKVEVPVLCKHVRFFPSVDKKTGQTTFGVLKFPVLRVLITNGDTEHKITWSNTAPKLAGLGEFVYHWPDKMVYPKLKVGQGKRARIVDDVLSPKIRQAGDTQRFASHERFAKWLTERYGAELSGQIMSAFAERLAQLLAKKKAA